jgi:hypothetical protein
MIFPWSGDTVGGASFANLFAILVVFETIVAFTDVEFQTLVRRLGMQELLD